MVRNQSRSRPTYQSSIPRFGFLLLLLAVAIVAFPRIQNFRGNAEPTIAADAESARLELANDNGASASSIVVDEIADPPQASGTAESGANAEPKSSEQATATPAASDSEPIDAPEQPAVANPLELDAQSKDLLSIVADNTTRMVKREMPAYWDLLKRTMSVTYADLRQEARSDYKFNDFYSQPTKHRGKLATIELTVRRVTKYDAEPNNQAGVAQVYEIWGSTDQSHAWLYVFITDKLPEGFDEKSMLLRKAKCTGYFFKILAYQPGAAAPNAKPLAAPMLIGQVDKIEQKIAPKRDDNSLYGFIAIAILGAIFLIIRVSLTLSKSRRGPANTDDDEPKDWSWIDDNPPKSQPEA